MDAGLGSFLRRGFAGIFVIIERPGGENLTGLNNQSDPPSKINRYAFLFGQEIFLPWSVLIIRN